MRVHTTIKAGPRGVVFHERTDGSPSSMYVEMAGEDTVNRTVEVHFQRGNVSVKVDGRQVFPDVE